MRFFSTIPALLLFLCTCLHAQTTRYVKAADDGGDINANGLSWTTASSDLQAMINASDEGDEVWVAQGTYIPRRKADDMSDAHPDSRYNAFVMRDGVKIFEGFAGGEELLTERDSTGATRTTILSGDLGVPGDSTDNAYHVVISAGVNSTAELNGFTVTGGTGADDSEIFVNNTLVVAFVGGGIYCNNSWAVFRNLIVTRNSASISGGGIASVEGHNVFERVIVSKNKATLGGGIHLGNSRAEVRNSAILDNYAGNSGAVQRFRGGYRR